MLRMKERKSWRTFFAVSCILLLVGLSLSCGCIEVGADDESQGSDPQVAPATTRASSSVQGSSPSPKSTIPWNPQMRIPPEEYYRLQGASQATTVQVIEGPVPGEAVYTDPIPPAISANTSYRELNLTTDFFPRPYDYPTAPFFQETYTLSRNNVALIAMPDAPPFVVEFKVEAETTNPYDAQVLITVRDNSTSQIVAEDGYNGRYSSDAVKRITIREAGEYHVNLYGYAATVQLVLRGGVPEEQAVPYWTWSPVTPTRTYSGPYPPLQRHLLV